MFFTSDAGKSTSFKFPSSLFLAFSTDNGLGDPCDGDFDDDKVPDAEDACSVNHHCRRTDFTNLLTVNLSPYESLSLSKPAIWVVDSTVSICTLRKHNNFLVSQTTYHSCIHRSLVWFFFSFFLFSCAHFASALPALGTGTAVVNENATKQQYIWLKEEKQSCWTCGNTFNA